MIDSLKPRSKSVAIDSKRQHEDTLQNIKHNMRRISYHKKVLNAWRYKIRYSEMQQKEEASLDLTDKQKPFYRQGKILFDFFKIAYLDVLKKKKIE